MKYLVTNADRLGVWFIVVDAMQQDDQPQPVGSGVVDVARQVGQRGIPICLSSLGPQIVGH
jgi:hypothetical protein